jgi:hypothetical protein
MTTHAAPKPTTYPAAPKPTTTEAAAATVPAPKPKTPEELKAEAEAEKAEQAAIDKVATINSNLAKDGSTNRVDYQMRAGEAHYRWGNFVPTRELTLEELNAVETMR